MQALYQPTLVLRDKTTPKQFDMVMDIVGEDGPLLVPVLTDTAIDLSGVGKVATIRTIFGKPVVSKGQDAVSISSRIRAGQLVYADTGMQLSALSV